MKTLHILTLVSVIIALNACAETLPKQASLSQKMQTTNCITVPQAKVGQKTMTLIYKASESGKAKEEVLVTKSTHSLLSTKRVTSAENRNEVIHTDLEEHFKHKNNHKLLSKIVGNMKVHGMTIYYVDTYTPAKSLAGNTLCKDDTWKSIYSVDSVGYLGGKSGKASDPKIKKHSHTITVTSVNDKKKVKAGNFNVYTLRTHTNIEGKDGVIWEWFDLKTGVLVAQKTLDEHGKTTESHALISLNDK